jgi:hypothetical protein
LIAQELNASASQTPRTVREAESGSPILLFNRRHLPLSNRRHERKALFPARALSSFFLALAISFCSTRCELPQE